MNFLKKYPLLIKILDGFTEYYPLSLPIAIVLLLLGLSQLFVSFAPDHALANFTFRVGLFIALWGFLLGLLTAISYNTKLKKIVQRVSDLESNIIKKQFHNVSSIQDLNQDANKQTNDSIIHKSLYEKFKDEFWISDVQKHPSRNYILLIIGIILALAIVGNYFAMNLTINPIDYEYSEDFENFSLETKIINLNNPNNGLIRETELLVYTTTITSNSSKHTILHSSATIIRAGESQSFGHDSVKLSPYNSTEIKMVLPLAKHGINFVELNFKLYEDRSEALGRMLIGDGLLEDQDVELYYRVLTQSEYVTEIERIWVYQLLWITAIPFVILGVKSLKDIMRNNSSEKTS